VWQYMLLIYIFTMSYLFIYLFVCLFFVNCLRLYSMEWLYYVRIANMEGSGCCLLLGTAGIFLEGLRKTTNNVQKGLSLGRDLNSGLPRYATGMLTISHHVWSLCLLKFVVLVFCHVTFSFFFLLSLFFGGGGGQTFFLFF